MEAARISNRLQGYFDWACVLTFRSLIDVNSYVLLAQTASIRGFAVDVEGRRGLTRSSTPIYLTTSGLLCHEVLSEIADRS